MAIAYWCVFVAALLPYIWTSVAKAAGERYNNHDPRGWQATQSPRSLRAHAAHLNGFEAFPAFAAGVVLAQLAGVSPHLINELAVAFVVVRVLHGLFYVTDKPPLRSLMWLLGLVCALALIVLAALKAG